jgi:hypothetical protein
MQSLASDEGPSAPESSKASVWKEGPKLSRPGRTRECSNGRVVALSELAPGALGREITVQGE